MPTVSVIIPVHNDAAYLRSALDSAMQQTLSDIEIICVDDGSTDSTAEILAQYAAADSRFRLVTLARNSGILTARCRGVEVARGDYTMFLDGDDCLVPHACETAVTQIWQYGVDVLWFSYTVREHAADNVCLHQWVHDPPPATAAQTVTGVAVAETYTRQGDYATTLWDKIYRTSVLQEACGHADDFYCNAGEDLYLSFHIGLCADSFRGVITEPLYYYNYGLGMSGRSTLDLAGFRRWCEMGQLAGRLEAYLRSADLWETYGTYCRNLARRIALDCCFAHFPRLRQEDQAVGLNMIEDNYGDMLQDREFLRQLIVFCARRVHSEQELLQTDLRKDAYIADLEQAKIWYLEQLEAKDTRIAELENKSVVYRAYRKLFH